MKKFIKKAIWFLIIPLAYFSVIYLINARNIENIDVGLSEIKLLIVGDSHLQKAVDPSFFNKGENISQEAEPYVLTYWKLQKIFEQANPDTVLIGFAPHNLSAFNDLKFSNPFWADEMFKRAYPISHFEHIDQKIDVDYTAYYKTLWRQTAVIPSKNHVHFIGSYKNKEANDVSGWQKTIDRHYFINDTQMVGVSSLGALYLDSILDLCQQHNALPILLGSPLHENYRSHIPRVNYSHYRELKQQYISKGIMVLDLSEAAYPVEYFYDADHLNKKGAEFFSEEVANIMASLNTPIEVVDSLNITNDGQ